MRIEDDVLGGLEARGAERPIAPQGKDKAKKNARTQIMATHKDEASVFEAGDQPTNLNVI